MPAASKTSITSSTTEVFDAGNDKYKQVILTNLNASAIWLAFNEAAVANEGFKLEAAGTAGDRVILTHPVHYPNTLNAISESATGDLSWQRV